MPSYEGWTLLSALAAQTRRPCSACSCPASITRSIHLPVSYDELIIASGR
ncbi:hypothetical protein QLQ12_17190 [Actinoplanes sp. NEAU-A12]|uniref:Uncharacterized protein n=1 Tax=Actinoplanes sandaracinus TaxID=3045177 RepID=A0ABT6WKU3_9ACTN|nr:hypothetical protein [Actinoplanes sandaracinus]MDI6100344.1 hypothetical protein [Actinoplanes sandaracinus]